VAGKTIQIQTQFIYGTFAERAFFVPHIGVAAPSALVVAAAVVLVRPLAS